MVHQDNGEDEEHPYHLFIVEWTEGAAIWIEEWETTEVEHWHPARVVVGLQLEIIQVHSNRGIKAIGRVDRVAKEDGDRITGVRIGEEAGRATDRARIINNRVTVTEAGTVGISSITISIGANNNSSRSNSNNNYRAVRQPQAVIKL